MHPLYPTRQHFLDRLVATGADLPPRLRQCADAVAVQPDRIAVMTVAELAAAAGVQPSAVIRFCQEMGFSGFSEMQRLFRRDHGALPDYATRIAALRAAGTDAPAALLGEFTEAARASLEETVRTVAPTSLEAAVRALVSAQTIHLAGFRRAFPVAAYLAYALERTGAAVLLHDGAGGLSASHTIRAGDALVAIAFTPVSSETVALADAAHAAGARVLAITDSLTGPVAAGAVTLLVRETDVGAFRTLSASMTLAMTLAVATGAARDRL